MNRFLSFCLVCMGLWLLAGPTHAQVYYVDLAAQPLGFSGATFYVEQVLDGRTNRAGIGTVHRGMNNIPQVAGLRPNVATALTNYLQAQLPRTGAEAQQLLLVVRQLRLSEDMTPLYEKASLDLAMDAYVHLPDGYHYALNAGDFIEGKGIETTVRHAPNLALALQHCLAQCQRIDRAKATSQPARSLEYLMQIGRPAGPAAAYPILTDSVLVRGYFPTFLSFRNHQPVTQPPLLVESRPRSSKGWEGTTEVTPYLTLPTGEKENLRKVWGFSDGKQLYIWHNRHFLPLKKQRDTFGFVGFSGADPGAVGTAAVLGGAVGGAIAAVATNDQPIDYTLSMSTGSISQFDDPGTAVTADTAMLCVYRRAGAGVGPVQVLLNNKPIGELGENQFLFIPWLDKAHEPRLCLSSNPSQCLSFLPVFSQTNYARISRNPTDAANPPLELVASKVGDFDIRQIKVRTKSRSK